jgi:hypothetical protein
MECLSFTMRNALLESEKSGDRVAQGMSCATHTREEWRSLAERLDLGTRPA